jgi:hypothetical protein
VFTIDGTLVLTPFCNVFNVQVACAFQAKQQLFADENLLNTWCSRCVSQCSQTDFQTDYSAQSALSKGDREMRREILLTHVKIKKQLTDY